MDNIYYRSLLNDKIKIEPKYLSKEFRQYVLSRLKDMLEGKCSKHGYIKTNSIELYKVAPGSIEMVGLNGNINYEVHFYAEVCNPLIGNVVRATVTNMNKFGILAEVGNILEIIIPKNSVNIVHDMDPESIVIGHQVIVEVVAKKYELNDTRISIVGRLVSGDMPKKQRAQNVDGTGEEEAEEYVMEEEEPVSSEEEEEEEAETASQPDEEEEEIPSFFDTDDSEEEIGGDDEEDIAEEFSEEEGYESEENA